MFLLGFEEPATPLLLTKPPVDVLNTISPII